MAKAQKKKRKTKKRESKQRSKNRLKLLKIFVLLVITLLIYPAYCLLTLPDMTAAINRTRQPSTTIIAENGNEIRSYGTVYSEVVRTEELPQFVVDAIIATEDRRFYQHFGFDAISFTRAMIANAVAGRYVQGGSTITQQVAKNLFLTSQKNLKRKVQELLLAFWLEYKFSKEQILTLYLNRVYLGSGTYGIEAASQKYFQKSSRDLNMLEAAVIAGMLKAPSRYNPIASKERALDRAAVVLKVMQENKFINEAMRRKILKMPLGREKNGRVQDAGYFADWTYNEINDLLGERDNDIYALTTLDQELQELIGKFNLCQYNYRTEDAKKDKDEAKLSQLYSEITDLYAQIMENDSMKEYNECKTEVDRLTQHIQAIITAAINGGDPMAVELPAGGCSGNCSGCSGCGN